MNYFDDEVNPQTGGEEQQNEGEATPKEGAAQEEGGESEAASE